MAEVSLDRLSILVVEDNSFIRVLLGNVIRSLGVEQVFHSPSASDAIDQIHKVNNDPASAGISVIDLIVVDVVMPEVDGNMLLRWIRSAESPDRFLPTIMISGAAGFESVRKARDMGATEFLAKPFSGLSVADKLMRTVFSPRQFVLAPQYFGPDRRRAPSGVLLERRIREEDDILVVYEDSTPHGIDEADVIHFRFQNRLAGKVGGFSLTGIPKLNPEIIAAADSKIEAVAGDYSDWALKSVRGLSKSLTELSSDGGQSVKLLAELNNVAHELRGQGGTFGYPLVTEFAQSLFQATTDSRVKVTDNHMEFYKAHIDAINVVMTNKVKGDGGEVGQSLLKGLEAARKKYAAAYA
ncbi:MAG: response regulator [Alphaproteobacteria bacterium]|jgi:CheY-like chemotaxis protein|nr:response regulator [Alphaproteobacteria bacterium]